MEVKMVNLAKLREKRGLTQENVSRIMGIDRSTVAKWEAGDALPRADKLPILAKLLKPDLVVHILRFGCRDDECISVVICRSIQHAVHIQHLV